MTKQFRSIHIYLSLFFLPLALMYAATGVLYIMGFDKNSGAIKNSYTLTQNIKNGQEIDVLIQFLKDNNLSIPFNLEPKKNKNGTLSIGGTHYSASIAKNSDSTYTVTTLERSIIGDMFMLHKAKTKWYFNILAIGFSATLILLYISGLMITLFNNRKNRGIQYATILAGFIVSISIGILSVL